MSPSVSYCSLKGARNVFLSWQDACYPTYKSFLLQRAESARAEQATIFDAYNTEWKPDMEVIPQCNIYSSTYRRHLRCYTAN